MKTRLFRRKTAAIFSVAILLFSAACVENIDPDDDDSQYAWGENVGWLNLEPDGDGGPGVEVEDWMLTGYMWGENVGWISLSCENSFSCATVDYGVTNDGNGNLSGYAWGENTGWISFSCENTATCGTVDYGVTIDPATGEFSGYAWGENIGWIDFAPDGVGARTSWGQTSAICATLGTLAGFAGDQDIFRFTGQEGEEVAIRLETDPNGHWEGKYATLTLDIPGRDVMWLSHWGSWRETPADRAPLAIERTMTLPATGEYEIWVIEQDGNLAWPLSEAFEGDYCLTLKSSQGAWQTLQPARSVE
jgi:hypothetical protein